MIRFYSHKGFVFVCLCAFFCFMNHAILAHKEPTHHYIIREAYSLLKKHIGTSIPEYDTYILGFDGLGREGEFDDGHANPWSYTTVCGGAWSEDHHDPVRNMHEIEMLFKKACLQASIIFGILIIMQMDSILNLHCTFHGIHGQRASGNGMHVHLPEHISLIMNMI